MQREEKIWLVCFQREEYWCGMGSRRGTETWPHLTTTFSQRRRTWSKPSAPTSTSAAWWAMTVPPLTGGCNAVLCVSLCPHPIDAPRVQTMFLEEEDLRSKGRVASLKIRFQELSGGREDEGYKENTWAFWKVLLSRREF